MVTGILPPANQPVYASASAMRSCPQLFDSAQDSGANAVAAASRLSEAPGAAEPGASRCCTMRLVVGAVSGSSQTSVAPPEMAPASAAAASTSAGRWALLRAVLGGAPGGVAAGCAGELPQPVEPELPEPIGWGLAGPPPNPWGARGVSPCD